MASVRRRHGARHEQRRRSPRRTRPTCSSPPRASSNSVNQGGTGYTTRSTAFGNRTQDRNVTSRGLLHRHGDAERQRVGHAARRVQGRRRARRTRRRRRVPTGSPRRASRRRRSTSLDGVDRQRRRHRLPGLPERHAGRRRHSTTTYQDTGLTPATAYTYTVSAFDAAGNASAAVAERERARRSRRRSDTTPPTVSLTAPAAGATVSGTVDGHRRSQPTTSASPACSSCSTARTSAPRTRRRPTRSSGTRRRRRTAPHAARRARARRGRQRHDDDGDDGDRLEHGAAAGRACRELRLRRGHRHDRGRRVRPRPRPGTLTNGAGVGGRQVRHRGQPRRRRRLRRPRQPDRAAAHGQHDDQRVDQLGGVPGRRRGRSSPSAASIGFQLDTTHRPRAAHDRLQAHEQLRRRHVPVRRDHAAAEQLVPRRRRLRRVAATMHVYLNGQLDDGAAGRHRHRDAAELPAERAHRPASRPAAASASTAASTTCASTAGR